MPAISIIVPIYNVEKYLPDCLESIKSQTYKDYECICVDDGSPDNCSEIVKEYVKNDSRFRLIKQNNQGLASARNTGIDHAEGDYITFVDSDDFIHSKTLELFYNNAQENESDYICGSFATIDEESFYKDLIYKNLDINSKSLIVTSNPIIDWLEKCPEYTVSAWTRLYHRKLFNDVRFVPEMRIHEDTYFTPLILSKSKKAVFLPNILYFYRQRRGSLIRSDSFRDSILACAHNAELVATLADHLNLSRRYKDLLLWKCSMSYFSIVVTNLILNQTIPQKDRNLMFKEARKIFKTLKKKKYLKQSMVSAKTHHVAFLLAYELGMPSLYRLFYRLVWPDRWRGRIELSSV